MKDPKNVLIHKKDHIDRVLNLMQELTDHGLIEEIVVTVSGKVAEQAEKKRRAAILDDFAKHGIVYVDGDETDSDDANTLSGQNIVVYAAEYTAEELPGEDEWEWVRAGPLYTKTQGGKSNG